MEFLWGFHQFVELYSSSSNQMEELELCSIQKWMFFFVNLEHKEKVSLF